MKEKSADPKQMKDTVRKDMAATSSVSRVLNRHFSEAKQANPRFSLRAFARRLGLSHSSLSEILAGTRRVSRRKAEQISKALGLAPDITIEFFEEFDSAGCLLPVPPRFRRRTLGEYEFRLVSSWHYFAILSLAETAGFVYCPLWISERLGISLAQAKEALHVLEELRFLVENGDGTATLTHRRLSSRDGVLDTAVQKNHLESLKLAQKALRKQPLKRRYFTSMTLALAPEQIPQIKELIRLHLNQVDSAAEAGSKREVYKLNVQFFALTQGVPENSNEEKDS